MDNLLFSYSAVIDRSLNRHGLVQSGGSLHYPRSLLFGHTPHRKDVFVSVYVQPRRREQIPIGSLLLSDCDSRVHPTASQS
jgi:hypothetical protein